MSIESMFGGFNISGKGLSAQRKRMNAIAANVANAETTRTEDGGPYRRKLVLLKAQATQVFSRLVENAGARLAVTDESHFGGAGSQGMGGAEMGVSVEADETIDSSPFRSVYDPGHPDADANGYVQMPNVNVVAEMVDMISATRTYEANVTALNAAKTMAKDTLEI